MYLRANFRIKQRKFYQWIIRIFMSDLHHAYLRLLRERDGLDALLQSSRAHGLRDRARVRHLLVQRANLAEIITGRLVERADLTEIIASLVAKDEDGNWTTVFDADTRLPDAYQVQLNILVNQA